MLQASVERRRFAGPGWSGHEQQAARAGQEAREPAVLRPRKAEAIERPQTDLVAQNANGQVLSEECGDDVDAEIDAFTREVENPPALLRTAVLGNVHAGRGLEEIDQVPALIA